jgi:molybdopterin-guanine dinucleotide biosynthesis protein A
MVNANRHLDLYRSYCDEVWSDEEPGFAGPLAGFWVGLAHAKCPYLMTVPCDTPLIPLDLSERLYSALSSTQADMAVVRSVDNCPKRNTPDDAPPLRAQPVLSMMRSHLAPRLRQLLSRGERKVSAWSREIHTVWVDYDQVDDDPNAFSNLNTLEDLYALE